MTHPLFYTFTKYILRTIHKRYREQTKVQPQKNPHQTKLNTDFHNVGADGFEPPTLCL